MTRTGIYEWSDCGYNWQLGCSNGCVYCYALAAAMRYRKVKSAEDFRLIRPYPLSALPSFPVRKRVMVPTQHDVTVENIERAVMVIRRLIAQGCDVLLCTKARLECVQRICNDVAPEHLEIRVTLGSLDEEWLKIWEPFASTPKERLAAIQLARSRGFRVSVSSEPLLDPWDANTLIEACLKAGADEIWIGAMNKCRTRLAHLPQAFFSDAVKDYLSYQTPEKIRETIGDVEPDFRSRVRLKDSYAAVIPQHVFYPEGAERG